MTLPPANDSRTAANAAFRKFLDRGDPAAIADLFDLCSPALRRTAVHLVGDAATADDLVQITFLAALEQRTFDRDRDVEPWLAGILRNQAALVHRRRSRALERDRLPAEVGQDPAQLAADRELRDEIERAVAGLPTPLQPVVRLHVLHGLQAGEIAASLSRPGGTVRTQLMRGLQRLRELLPVGIAGVLAGLVPAVGLTAARDTVVAAAMRAGRRAGIGVSTAAAWWLRPQTWLVGLLGVAAAVVAVTAWPRSEPLAPPAVVATAGDRALPGQAAPVPQLDQQPTRRTDAALPAASAPPAAEYELRGVVHNADGKLAAAVEVLLWATDKRPVTRGSTFEPAPAAMAVTGADGSFAVRGRGQRCYLLARGDGTCCVRAITGQLNGRTAIAGLELTLGEVVLQRGELIDDEGRPVPRFAFGTHRGGGVSPSDRLEIPGFARAELPFLDTVTDDAGHFAAPAVAAFEYLWEVQHQDHPMLRVRHRPADGPLVLQLEAGEVIHGVVYRTDGSPARGAKVEIHDYPRRHGVCGDDGRFTLRGVERRARMMLTVDDPESAILCAALPAVGTPCELRLEPAKAIAGRVVDATGTPVPGVQLHVVGDRLAPNDVEYTEPDTWEFQFDKNRATSGADGAFAFERLYDGLFEVRVKVPGATDEVVLARVRSGAPAVELRLDDAARHQVTIGGAIRDGVTGLPVSADIVVWRRHADGTGASGVTEKPQFVGDRYELPGLAAGELRLEFRAVGYADEVLPWRTFAPGEQVVDAVLYPVRRLLVRATESGGPGGGRVWVRVGTEPLMISDSPGNKRSSLDLVGGEVRIDGLPARVVTVVLDAGEVGIAERSVDLAPEPVAPLVFELEALAPIREIPVLVLLCNQGFDPATLGAPTERAWLQRALAAPGVAPLDAKVELRLEADGAVRCRGAIEPLPPSADRPEGPAYRTSWQYGGQEQSAEPERLPAVTLHARGAAFTLVVEVAGQAPVRRELAAADVAAELPVAVFVPRQ
ncbi:MAG: sigma-70 family RNA polymerase sigma factor [Planctomycetota bacterium]